MSTSKQILYVQRRSPLAGAEAYESLEGAILARVFDQNVTVLFMDDGVYQLCEIDTHQLGMRNVNKLCASLGLYEIEQVYVSAKSLEQRGLLAEDLSIAAEAIPAKEISALVSRHEIVISS